MSLTSSSSTLSSGSLTCIACKLLFESGDEQREHYKTEFHRFNLKRKVAELPPVNRTQYDELMVRARQLDADKINNANKRNRRRVKHGARGTAGASGAPRAARPSHACHVCGKRFSCKRTLEQHQTSKKHENREQAPVPDLAQRSAAAASDPDDLDDLAADERAMDDADVSAPAAAELQPRTEEEWIEWKIARGVQLAPEACLFCTHVAGSLDEAIEHMGRQHGFVVPDPEYVVDLAAFMHYLSQKVSVGNVCLRCGNGFLSMEAARCHMRDKSHCRLPLEAEEAEEYCDFYDYAQDHENAEEADVGGDGSDQRLAGEPQSAHPAASSSSRLVSVEAHRLLFSDGRSVGHRSLSRYYKQKYAPADTRDAVLISSRVASQYRLLGLHTSHSLEVRRTMHEQKLTERRRLKHSMQLGVQSNALFVVRPQVIF